MHKVAIETPILSASVILLTLPRRCGNWLNTHLHADNNGYGGVNNNSELTPAPCLP